MSLTVDIEKRLGDFCLRAEFEAESGVTGLLGASGCGKSLTLKCVAGIETPDRGRIVLDGRTLYDSEKHINLKPQQRRVGYLFQNYALFPNMTAEQNILCGLHAERDKARKRQALEQALRLFQLEEVRRHKPHQLSGGQQQRVALARIRVNKPELLLLDEPFSALDTHLRMRLQMQMLEVLEEYGRPVLMVTHSRDEAYHMCGKIAVMQGGSLMPPAPTKELFANPQTVHTAVLTGCKNIARAKKAGLNLLEVPDWGVMLETALPVPDGVTHAGIRAHYFSTRETRNRFAVVPSGDMEEPFEWVVEFRYADQRPDTPTIWWRVPKERRPQQMPAELGVAPVNVLALREEPPFRSGTKT
ncbi:MAG: ATP-binding cassette domain-containing protein [Clostridia bacterium]|nr:ATP-binding cassette domain-containing protein [Clostridia bacterium]